MKAYQVRLEFRESSPRIWRRVVMPANSTFERLHSIIQFSFAFDDCHLYMFNFPERRMKVTNDDEAYQIYQEYKENQEQMEKTLSALNTPFARRQLEALRTVVFKPHEISFDEYLQGDGAFHYLYDFNDQWEIEITLEGQIDDYTLPYPTILAGEQGAPLERMGGLSGFEEFLEAYNDSKHPDYEAARQWAKREGYGKFDVERIQNKLKRV